MGDRTAFILRFDPRVYAVKKAELLDILVNHVDNVYREFESIGLILGCAKGSWPDFFQDELECILPDWVEAVSMQEFYNT